jgi:AraC family ethanolamine operon transcriptional activator
MDTANAHWALVQRAVVLVNEAPDSAPTVTQMCLALGVSRRTLQNAFLRVLEMSPLAYVKAVRLKQAREALKNARSVTEAATACGFWHFGHFSQDYQTMFGERPSDTLRRQA